MLVVWKRLIRFIATDGRMLYGEPLLPSPGFNAGQPLNDVKLEAKVVQGQDMYDTVGATKVTDEVAVVKKISVPLTPRDVPILRCIGLNYATHSTNGPGSSHSSDSSGHLAHQCLQIARSTESRRRFRLCFTSPLAQSSITARLLLSPKSLKIARLIMKANWYVVATNTSTCNVQTCFFPPRLTVTSASL